MVQKEKLRLCFLLLWVEVEEDLIVQLNSFACHWVEGVKGWSVQVEVEEEGCFLKDL